MLKTPTISTLSTYTITYSLGLPTDANCRLKITAPSGEFDVDSSFNTVSGYSTFINARDNAFLSTSNTNTIIIDGCDSYFNARRNADTLDISYFRNPNSLKDSTPFRLEFYAVDGNYEYLTATDNTSIKVHGQ